MSSISVLMKLTGESSGWIKGESEFADFKDCIEIQDWGWMLDRKDGKSDSEPSLFSFDKLMDRSTTAMLVALREGESLLAEITVKDFIDKGFELQIKLTAARLTDYAFDAKTGDSEGEVEEKWKFDYESIEFGHRDDPQKPLTTVVLLRPANAEHSAPETVDKKLIDLASEMAPGDLKNLWQKLLDAAEGGRFGTATNMAATVKPSAVKKGTGK